MNAQMIGRTDFEPIGKDTTVTPVKRFSLLLLAALFVYLGLTHRCSGRNHAALRGWSCFRWRHHREGV